MKGFSVAGLLSLSAVLVSGCGVPIKPDDLQTPSALTCIFLKEPLSSTGKYGLVQYEWTTRLQRGPYWSEKMDDKGTYYRAPPGGVLIADKDGRGIPGQGATHDGGFYVPDDPKEPIRIYKYFSTQAAPVQIPPVEVDCSNVGYVKDPATAKVSVVAFALGGAAGGAAGAVLGRSMADSSSLSYGQAAGAGAAGGLIAGFIVASIINADVGKIVGGLPIEDKQFLDRLRELAAAKVPFREVQLPAGK